MNWDFKDMQILHTDDLWYDLTYGGYVTPEMVLNNQYQINELKKAIELVWSFQNAYEEKMENQE